MITHLVGADGQSSRVDERGIWNMMKAVRRKRHRGEGGRSLETYYRERATTYMPWSDLMVEAFLTMLKECLQVYPSRRRQMNLQLMNDRFFTSQESDEENNEEEKGAMLIEDGENHDYMDWM